MEIIQKTKPFFKKKECLSEIFGLSFMDTYHHYIDVYSNIRYYHRLKAGIVEKNIGIF